MIPNTSLQNIGTITKLELVPLSYLTDLRVKNGICHLIYDTEKAPIEIYFTKFSAKDSSENEGDVYRNNLSWLAPKERKDLFEAIFDYINQKCLLIVTYASGTVKLFGSIEIPLVLRFNPTPKGLPADYNGYQFNVSNIDFLPGRIVSIIEVTVVVTDVTSWLGSDGEIQIIASGGISPYEYGLRTDGEWSAYQETDTFTGLEAGIYAVRVRDTNGSVTTLEAVIVHQPIVELEIVNVEVTNATYIGATDGTITVTAQGGYSPYNYAIKTTGGEYGSLQSSNEFTGLGAGTYSVKVVDNVGTIVEEHNISIIESDLAFIQPLSITDVTTHGGSDGIISCRATGGIPAIFYQIKLSSGEWNETWTSNYIFDNLSAGTYDVRCMDTVGSTDYEYNIVVSEPPA